METSEERRNESTGTESVTFEEIRQMQRNNELRAERDRIERQRMLKNSTENLQKPPN